jgi:hypothetical protein
MHQFIFSQVDMEVPMQDDSHSGSRPHQSHSPRIVPVRLDDQTVIHIETASPSIGSDGDSLIASRIPTFDEVTNTIKGISKALIEVWQEVQPAGAIVEFGVDVAVESGISLPSSSRAMPAPA